MISVIMSCPLHFVQAADLHPGCDAAIGLVHRAPVSSTGVPGHRRVPPGAAGCSRHPWGPAKLD